MLNGIPNSGAHVALRKMWNKYILFWNPFRETAFDTQRLKLFLVHKISGALSGPTLATTLISTPHVIRHNFTLCFHHHSLNQLSSMTSLHNSAWFLSLANKQNESIKMLLHRHTKDWDECKSREKRWKFLKSSRSLKRSFIALANSLALSLTLS